MSTQKVTIRVKGPTVAESNILAQDLRDRLLGSSPDITIERRKEDPNTQDMGATLILVLGTPAIVAIAKGIENWLCHHEGQIEMEMENGKVKKFKAKDISAATMETIIDLLRKQC